jgi:hypothetical protein
MVVSGGSWATKPWLIASSTRRSHNSLPPIFEPLLSDGSYGYRPEQVVKQTIQKVKEYAKQRYAQAVLIDLAKCFDTLNHELLMNMVCEEVHDKCLTSHSHDRNVCATMTNVKRYAQGKFRYFGIAKMKNTLKN